MLVVLKAAMILHAFVQGLFAGMAERRMTQIVGQGDRLGQVLIQPELASDCPADLSYFQSVREASAVMIVSLRREDLGLVHQPAKGRRMNDAIPVALIERAIGMRRLRVPASSTQARSHRVRREPLLF